MEKTKMGSFEPKNMKQNNFAIAKSFTIQRNFRYHREISLCSEITLHSENFAIIAKFHIFSYLHPASSSLHRACFIFNFFIPGFM